MLPEPEYREIQRIARSRHMSTAEWVRQALNAARRHEPTGDAGMKLDVIRAAARHEFPSAHISEMLDQIESGYGADSRP